MSINHVNQLFTVLTETADVIQKSLGLSYLDALLETTENLIDQKIPADQMEELGAENTTRLMKAYRKIDLKKMVSEEKRRGFQLAILKGMREELPQPNHQMTPDSIGQLMSYFIQLFLPETQRIHLVDLASGTGNLLSVVTETLEALQKSVVAEGVEVDELLISLASVNFALQGKNIRLTHQDALTNLLIEPSDVVVADVPVGYYPQDDIAEQYTSSFKEGHSFAHYLFIEQGMNYLKESGLGLFLVPGSLFEEETSRQLIQMIQQRGYIQAIIHLPDAWFKSDTSRKNLIVLQKKGHHAKQSKEVLFANAPDFKQPSSVTNFLKEIQEWKESVLGS